MSSIVKAVFVAVVEVTSFCVIASVIIISRIVQGKPNAHRYR